MALAIHLHLSLRLRPGICLDPYPNLYEQPSLKAKSSAGALDVARIFMASLLLADAWKFCGMIFSLDSSDQPCQVEWKSPKSLYNIGKDLVPDQSSASYSKSTGDGWNVNHSTQQSINMDLWYFDDLPSVPGAIDGPGPLPLVGAGAAYGWTRRL